MVPYSFYISNYAAPGAEQSPPQSIPETDWPFYAERSAEQMARYKRIYAVSIPADLADKIDVAAGIPFAEAMAICAMAEAMASFDAIQNSAGGPVSSASVGSVSVSYGSSPANTMDVTPQGQARELYRCASRYLEIYRGVG